jgi:hypothetical protein
VTPYDNKLSLAMVVILIESILTNGKRFSSILIASFFFRELNML